MSQETPWWVYIPIVGLIGAMVQHGKACSCHAQACKDYELNKVPMSATWDAFSITWIWFDNCGKALISTFGAMLVFCWLISFSR